MTAIVRRTAIATTVAAAVCLSSGAGAQPLSRRGPLLGPPEFLDHLYPPRLVMRHQAAIELADAQRTTITTAIGETRGRLTELEWKREAIVEAVGRLVAQPRIDEEAAMARAAELMEVEEQIKREHLRLLIRIKNALTVEQQRQLDDRRDDRRRRRRARRPRAAP